VAGLRSQILCRILVAVDKKSFQIPAKGIFLRPNSRYLKIQTTMRLSLCSVRPGTTTKPTTPAPPPVKPGDKPTGTNSGTGGTTPVKPGTNAPNNKQTTYKLALLLPFSTNQYTEGSATLPEKNTIALQYYAGMQLGFAAVSQMPNYPDFVVDVVDSQVSDAEFQQVLNTNARLKQAQVILGPLRNSHVGMMAKQAKTTRQIVVSPESPTSELTEQNPYFVQTNPPLRAHCARIVQYLRSEKKRPADHIVLVCKEKEADRLPYFREANLKYGTSVLKEVIVPDASVNFDKVDLKKFIKPGQTTAFVMPSWAGSDWVLAFLSRLKQQKGNNTVEVYGMPQWADYEHLEPELLSSLNVHISSAKYIDRTASEVQEFEQLFYEKFGTLPDDDAYAGYDVVKFTAALLQKYGLDFPEKASESGSFFPAITGGYYLRRVPVSAPSAPMDAAKPVLYDYIENIYVHILKFEQFKYQPVEP
jgi:ABC-type branched-subunit amino acid transport system substrate-binding protein